MTTIEGRVSRLEGGYKHLSTSGDVRDVRVEVANVRGEVAEPRGEVHALKCTIVLAVSGAAGGRRRAPSGSEVLGLIPNPPNEGVREAS